MTILTNYKNGVYYPYEYSHTSTMLLIKSLWSANMKTFAFAIAGALRDECNGEQPDGVVRRAHVWSGPRVSPSALERDARALPAIDARRLGGLLRRRAHEHTCVACRSDATELRAHDTLARGSGGALLAHRHPTARADLRTRYRHTPMQSAEGAICSATILDHKLIIILHS